MFPVHHQYPDWSTQNKIVYLDEGIVCVYETGVASVDPSLVGLWTIDVDSGQKSLLLAGLWFDPDWSPDGKHLAVSAQQVFTTSTDSVALQQITFEGRNFFPAWSPDGTWLSYDSNATDPPGLFAVWLYSFGSGQSQMIAPGVEGRRMPSWSPDGSKLAHIRYPGGDAGSTSEVYTMDIIGTQAVRLTTDRAEDRTPCFSPDGTQIAFSKQNRESSENLLPQVWVMNSDGTQARQVTTLGGSHPSWSPDGTRIVYVREDWRSNTSGAGVLWVLDVVSGDQSQLTTKWPNDCGAD